MKDRRITFDETQVRIAWNLGYQHSLGIGGGGSLQVQRTGDGSSYGASLQGGYNPSNGAWRVGPMFRVGGIGVGLMAGKGGVTPQIGIGGMTLTLGAGICAGFICADGGRPGFIDPKTMILASVMKTLSTILSMEREDSPLMILNGIVSGFIPIEPVLDTLAVMGVPLGRGPRARRIAHLPEMAGYLRGIEGLVSTNGRVDAIRRLTEAIALRQDPYVEAELRSKRDGAHVERNTRDLPFGDAIEQNIRAGVDAVEAFMKEHGTWLRDGSGRAPSVERIEQFMGRALYLARKLYFTFDRTMKRDRTVLKIRTSEPFRIQDPRLAVRYAETMAAAFTALSRPSSGLVAHIRAETERRHRTLLNAMGASRIDAHAVLTAKGRHMWHITWIRSMGDLYEQGFFHMRMKHLRAIVARRAAGEDKRRLLIMFDAIEYVDMNSLQRTMMSMASSTIPPARQREIAPGLAALAASEELSSLAFPDELGDATLLFNRERARNFNRRAQIVDALYAYAALMESREKHADRGSPAAVALTKLAAAARANIVRTMQRFPDQVRHEWWEYVRHTTGTSHWRDLTADRLEDAATALKRYPTNPLFTRTFIERLYTASNDTQRRALSRLVRTAKTFTLRLEETRNGLQRLAARARGFAQGPAHTVENLFAAERENSQAINEGMRQWQSLMGSYAHLKALLLESAIAKEKVLEDFFKKAEKQLQLTDHIIGRALANYERFNARRIGAPYLHRFMEELNIPPLKPREENACPACP